MYKIAVIEDDTLLGQALVEMLTSHGYQAFAAESVTKARRLMERQPVDLLLIDRGLADGDGVELCRQRSGQEKLPAIFLTARDEEEDIVEAFDAGADDYLVKPVALAVLLKHIEAVLRRTGGEPNQVFFIRISAWTMTGRSEDPGTAGSADTERVRDPGSTYAKSEKSSNKTHASGTGLG